MQRLRLLTPALAILAGLGAMWAALAFGGGADPLAIDDSGPLVRYGLPAATMLRNLSVATAFGGLVLACFALAPGSRDWNRTLDLAALATGVATALQACIAFATFRQLVSNPVTADDEFGRLLQFVFTQTEPGRLSLGTLLAFALLTVVLLVARGSTAVAFTVVAWAVPFWLIASGGHAGGTANHALAVSSLLLHLVFVSIWLGGLLHAGLLAKGRDDAPAPGASASGASAPDVAYRDVLERYSTLALVSFGVVAFTGVVSAWVRMEGDWLSDYGILAIAKAVLLVALGAFGAWQRMRILRPARESRERVGSGAVAAILALELVVMGVTAGVAAGLARTATPVPEVPPGAEATPAEILTQQPLPPEFTLLRLVTEWRIDPLWTVACALFAFFYLTGVARLARRGDRWPVGRTFAWLAGVALLWWCTNGALNVYQEFQFSLHMLVHMLLGMAVPVLLVPGAPITLAMRAIAKRRDGSMGGREWLMAIVHSKYLQVVGHPVVAAIIFVASLWLFYFTPLFEWSMRDHLGHVWMVVHFVGSGYLFVQAIIGVDPGPARPPYPLRLTLLLGTMVFHAFFGLSLMMGDALLLADWFGAMGNGLDALEDQRVGGGIAWSVGEVPTVIMAIITTITWSRSDKKEQVRTDRAAARDGDAELGAYNAMLERMGKR
ncbi:bifunctional copper resistance protein CopD/cytochrome c oxidase assembly protein [Agrococcus sp. HG114]|uniref:bifunctional copper resistance protein CopD/cytochrome c oxidase assembly protein n=1 Tax=Agrococcus sp. HG114 TaxID=2969757 RepID=UPI00215A9C50|nr:bifunctional copper resistance protein CopD/cytochrome c oxidase assembly protein [Agrococcus sp. HG114]MCR8670873.1 bifunctional copper resistance protein CopD/cytochrome c oxidase assembly protein [Agrococcus sp. HG114]